MTTHEMPKCRCPFCGYEFDRSSGVAHPHQPRPGDVTICIDCASIGVFDDDLTVRVPTPAERLQIAENKELLQAQIMVAGLTRKEADE